MDPISAIKHVVAGIQMVMQIKAEMQANQAECKRLIERIGGFEAPLAVLMRQKQQQQLSTEPAPATASESPTEVVVKPSSPSFTEKIRTKILDSKIVSLIPGTTSYEKREAEVKAEEERQANLKAAFFNAPSYVDTGADVYLRALWTLNAVVGEVQELINSFTQATMFSKMDRMLNRAAYIQKFADLNHRLDECRGDLHFAVSVAANDRSIQQQQQEAEEADAPNSREVFLQELREQHRKEDMEDLKKSLAASFERHIAELKRDDDDGAVTQEALDQLQREMKEQSAALMEEMLKANNYAAQSAEELKLGQEETQALIKQAQVELSAGIKAVQKQNGEIVELLKADRAAAEGQKVQEATQKMKEAAISDLMLEFYNLEVEEDLLDNLDKGGGSISLPAKKGRMREPVSLKVFRHQDENTPMPVALRQEVENEAFLLDQCRRTEFVIKLEGLCDMDDRTIAVVVEARQSCGPLSRLLYNKQAFPILPSSLVLAWLSDILKALLFLQNKQFVLCGNGVRAEGMELFSGKLLLKLSDFSGVCISTKESSAAPTAPLPSRSNSAFLAPELSSTPSRGFITPATTAANMWGFAMTLVQIVTRQAPAPLSSPAEALALVRDLAVLPLRAQLESIMSSNQEQKQHHQKQQKILNTLCECLPSCASPSPPDRKGPKGLLDTVTSCLRECVGGDPRQNEKNVEFRAVLCIDEVAARVLGGVGGQGLLSDSDDLPPLPVESSSAATTAPALPPLPLPSRVDQDMLVVLEMAQRIKASTAVNTITAEEAVLYAQKIFERGATSWSSLERKLKLDISWLETKAEIASKSHAREIYLAVLPPPVFAAGGNAASAVVAALSLTPRPYLDLLGPPPSPRTVQRAADKAAETTIRQLGGNCLLLPFGDEMGGKCVSFRECPHLTPDTLRLFAEPLRNLSGLVSLNLEGCGLGPEGMRPLAFVMQGCPGVDIISVSRNGIGYAGAFALASALLERYRSSDRTQVITKLFLAGNGITSPPEQGGAAVCLTTVLAELDCLKELDLSNNDLRGCSPALMALGARMLRSGTAKPFAKNPAMTSTYANLTWSELASKAAVAGHLHGADKDLVNRAVKQALDEAVRENELMILERERKVLEKKMRIAEEAKKVLKAARETTKRIKAERQALRQEAMAALQTAPVSPGKDLAFEKPESAETEAAVDISKVVQELCAYASTGRSSQLCRLLEVYHGVDAILNGRDPMSKDGDTAVLCAVKANKPDCLDYLLFYGCDANAKNRKGNCAVLYACGHGFAECLKILLKHGCDVHVAMPTGATPAHVAAHHGHHACLSLLVAAGSDIEQADESGRTPCSIATQRGAVQCVQVLAKSGANLDRRYSNGATVSHMAAAAGRTKILQVLDKHGANMKAKMYNKVSVHGMAELRKKTKSAQMLSEALKEREAEEKRIAELRESIRPTPPPPIAPPSKPAANPSASSAKAKASAQAAAIPAVSFEQWGRKIYEAARKNDVVGLAAALTGSGYAKEAINWANPDNDGRGALHEACFHQHLEAVQLLCDAPGIDFNMLDSRKRSPLHHKTSDKIKAVLDKAYRKSHSSVDGKELFEAAHKADMNALQALIEKMQDSEGGVVNWQNPDHDYYTPLHIACFECLPAVVEALLRVRGIDARVLDEFGKTALAVAKTNPGGAELEAVVAAFEAFQRRGGDVDLGAGDAAKLQEAAKVEGNDSALLLEDVEARVATMTTGQVVAFVQTHAKGLASTELGAQALLKKIVGLAGDKAERDAFAAAATTSDFWQDCEPEGEGNEKHGGC